jgi:hypothetical protein
VGVLVEQPAAFLIDQTLDVDRLAIIEPTIPRNLTVPS